MTSQDNRRAKRREVRHRAMIYAENGERLAACALRNVSVTGAQLEMPKEVSLPPQFILSLAQSGGVRRRCALVWQFSVVAGVRFLADE